MVGHKKEYNGIIGKSIFDFVFKNLLQIKKKNDIKVRPPLRIWFLVSVCVRRNYKIWSRQVFTLIVGFRK